MKRVKKRRFLVQGNPFVRKMDINMTYPTHLSKDNTDSVYLEFNDCVERKGNNHRKYPLRIFYLDKVGSFCDSCKQALIGLKLTDDVNKKLTANGSMSVDVSIYYDEERNVITRFYSAYHLFYKKKYMNRSKVTENVPND